MGERKCLVCGRAFPTMRNTKTCCRTCSDILRGRYVRAYRESHRSKMREYQRRYWDLIRKRRQRAKEAGGLFDA